MRTKFDTGNGIATVYRLKYLSVQKTVCYIVRYCHSLSVKNYLTVQKTVWEIQFLLKYSEVGKPFRRWKTVCTYAI